MQNPHCLLCLVCISLITSRAWWPCPPGRCCSPPPPPWSPSSAWSRQTERVLSLGSRRSGWGTLQSIIRHSTTFLLIFTHSSTVSHVVQYSYNFSRWPRHLFGEASAADRVLWRFSAHHLLSPDQIITISLDRKKGRPERRVVLQLRSSCQWNPPHTRCRASAPCQSMALFFILQVNKLI